jgi:hypothetical protein
MDKEYTTIDKAKWGAGPWSSEVDKIQFTDEATGLPCLIKRHPSLGFLCGYVGVAPGHWAYGKGYSEERLEALRVHGGLTYAAGCQHGDEATSICHVPEPGQPDDVWWLGFDCGHAFDLAPGARNAVPMDLGFMDLSLGGGESYRNINYVKRECAELAKQLKV